MVKKVTKRPEPKRTVGDLVSESLQAGAGTLRKVITALELTAVDDDNRVSHGDAELLASLMARLTQLQAEERKAEAERRRANNEVTHDEVVAWLMKQNAAQWSAIKQRIDERHSGRSGLSQ